MSESQSQNGWFRMPNALIDQMHTMPKSAVFVMLVLLRYADDQGRAWPSITTIQRLAAIRRRTTLWALGWLERSGFIKRTRRKTASTLYELQPPCWDSATREPTLGSAIALPRFPHCTRVVQPGNHEEDLIEKDLMTKKRERAPQRFIKPSVEEIAQYCKQRGNGIDPQAFWDFYESNGWKVGRNPMKDWKAAVRTWERRPQYGNGQPAPKRKPKSNLPYLDADILRPAGGRTPK